MELNGSSSPPVQLTVTNSTFQHSAAWGVYINAHSNVNADIETANTFSDNASGDITGL